MVKWLNEKVLQFYFNERCKQYSVNINNKLQRITSCTFNSTFNNFPDLSCKVGSQQIDCEVEWLSSGFDHFDHPYYPKFRKKRGFVVVFRKDQEISDLQQIIIDELDFRKWFRKNANRIFDESINELKDLVKHPRKTAAIWIIYVSKKMEKNLQVGIKNGVWGFVRNALKNRPELLEIKKNDILIFFGPTINNKNHQPIFARMGSFDNFYQHIKKQDYVIQNVCIYKINKGYWNEENQPSDPKGTYQTIWNDETSTNKKYPHRIGFKGLITKSSNIKLKKLGNSTIDFLRKSMQGISISEMSYTDYVELTRHLDQK